MFEKVKGLCQRMDELEARLSEPGLYDDPDRAAKLLKERNELEPIVVTYRAYEQAQQTIADATEMLSDPDMKELAQEELQDVYKRQPRFPAARECRLRRRFPALPWDNRGAQRKRSGQGRA